MDLIGKIIGGSRLDGLCYSPAVGKWLRDDAHRVRRRGGRRLSCISHQSYLRVREPDQVRGEEVDLLSLATLVGACVRSPPQSPAAVTPAQRPVTRVSLAPCSSLVGLIASGVRYGLK